MSILKRGPRPDSTRIYQCAQGFAYASSPAPTHIKTGARRRGDDPVLVATFASGLWLPDGASDSEIAAARTGPPLPAAPDAPVPARTGYGTGWEPKEDDPA